MKKKISLLLICILVCFQLVGCGSKGSITADVFANSAENHGYVISYLDEQYSAYPHIKSVIVAQKDGYQIEFFVLSSEDNAKSIYQTNAMLFDESKDGNYVETSSSGKNYNTYKVKDADEIMYVSRIDNTVFYARVNKAYEVEVSEIINLLGY